MTKNNAPNLAAANKNVKSISSIAGKAGATLVEDDVLEKKLIKDVVSAPKSFDLELEASVSAAKTVMLMEIWTTNALSLWMEA